MQSQAAAALSGLAALLRSIRDADYFCMEKEPLQGEAQAPLADLPLWQQAGVYIVDDVCEWISAGYNAHSAGEWTRQDIIDRDGLLRGGFTVHGALAWGSLGFTPAEAATWAGHLSPKDARACLERGYTVQDLYVVAAALHAADRADSPLAWLSTGLSVDYILSCAMAGLSPEEAGCDWSQPLDVLQTLIALRAPQRGH